MKKARFIKDGKQISMEKAYDEIQKLIPNGGTQFLDNLLANAKENKLDSIWVRVGNKGTMSVEFCDEGMY